MLWWIAGGNGNLSEGMGFVYMQQFLEKGKLHGKVIPI